MQPPLLSLSFGGEARAEWFRTGNPAPAIHRPFQYRSAAHETFGDPVCGPRCLCAATNADDKDDPTKKDLKALQGTWVTLKLVVDGKVLVDLKEPPKDEEAGTLTYNEHRWVLKLGDKELARGTSKLDPTKTPKQIDLIHESGPNKGKTLLGIYELDGDDYKGCVAAPGKKRPTEFTSTEGSGQRIILSKRQKR